MEANPGQAVVQHKAGRHNLFCEVERADAMVLEVIEIQAALLQLLD